MTGPVKLRRFGIVGDIHAEKAIIVRGNHERWFLEGKMRDLPGATRHDEVDAASRALLTALPSTRRVATIRGDLPVPRDRG